MKCGDRVLLDAFHLRGIYFRPLYEKPEITKDDMKERFGLC